MKTRQSASFCYCFCCFYIFLDRQRALPGEFIEGTHGVGEDVILNDGRKQFAFERDHHDFVVHDRIIGRPELMSFIFGNDADLRVGVVGY